MTNEQEMAMYDKLKDNMAENGINIPEKKPIQHKVGKNHIDPLNNYDDRLLFEGFQVLFPEYDGYEYCWRAISGVTVKKVTDKYKKGLFTYCRVRWNLNDSDAGVLFGKLSLLRYKNEEQREKLNAVGLTDYKVDHDGSPYFMVTVDEALNILKQIKL